MTVKSIWLKITNVQLNGPTLELQVEGGAIREQEGTWLTCTQKSPAPKELFKIVLKALQDGRETTGKLISEKSSELVISRVRVQFR